ncbi:RHS repeat-associated core domain-containing protein, partial [Xanthomonas sp. 3307]|uniref:RHS repeat domain-containing protein n=1 Tax=Xanthomonas sp. 3307 TaxID=3035316 RepID=UPI0017952C0E
MGDYDTNGKALQQAIWLDDLPVGVLAGTALNYVQPDHLGAPRAVIDSVRDVAIWAWDVKGEAFGTTPPNQDPDNDGTAFVFNLRFPGQRYDSATGLNQNYFRDYDAGTGRYAQSDLMGLQGSINTYAYANSQSIMLIDPFGLQSSAVVNSGAANAARGAYNPNASARIDGDIPIGRLFGNGSSDKSSSIERPFDERLLSAIYNMSPLGMASKLEGAVSKRLNNVCENGEDYCREVKAQCLDTCSETALPSRDDGFKFFRCVNKCMADHGCEGW